MRTLSTTAALLLTAAVPVAAAPHGLTIDDMNAMQRVGDPAVSPDGKHVAFAVRDTDLDANRGRYDVWLADIDGKHVFRLTTHPESDTDPAWSADGSWVYFLSTRSGSSQVWRIAPTGGEAEQVTKLPSDINGFKLFPDGKRLALTIDVWPDARTLEDSVKRDEQRAKSKVTGRIYDQLLMRHWDKWEDGKYSHLFVWASDKDLRDLTPGQTTDTPVGPFGGMEEITISPDGKDIAFEARVGGREEAWTTNTDIFLVSADGKSRAIDLTAKQKGYDEDPKYSPDGRMIAYTMMERAGFESDRKRIAVIDTATKTTRVVTEAWDRSADGLTWSRDGRTIYTTADNVGNHSLFAVDVATGKARVVVDKGSNGAPQLAGDQLVFSHDTLVAPAELFTVKDNGSEMHALTHLNDARVAGITWGAYEQFSFKGAHGDTVYGYVVKPAGYTGGKAPVAFLIHGGPQGTFDDHFHYRWNPEIYAGHGYAVVTIDFHGSTGYGQAFTDAISGDWGGAPYDDLMTGLDAAIAKYPWLDGSRVAALGASYGGYMINWIAGHTDRFKALVCHDGIFDTRMGYYDTDELWFDEWEHKATPWQKPADFEKDNPADFVQNWKTPMLVVHGAQDFRIPETHGLGAFTALQRRGIPSRLLEFPDENHWVLKPLNSKLWHDTVLAWLDQWTKRK
jgi:dipeptidyl aminopeptidase/acylaminoacyl peptidase